MKNLYLLLIALLCADGLFANQTSYTNQNPVSATDTIWLPPPPAMFLIFTGKVFLQGALNNNGVMDNSLNVNGILGSLAQLQPYNQPFYNNYKGNERVSTGFFSLHPEIVDWILLEVTGSSIPGITLRRAAFVRQDGTIVDLNGSPGVRFNEVGGGNYFVSIKHRNHLGIRTPAPLNFTTGTAHHDFTTAAQQAYQNQSYTSTIQVGQFWAMRGGNANANSNIKYNGPVNDQDQIQNVGLGGIISMVMDRVYNTADINMDGKIKTNGPGNDQNFLLNGVLNGSLGAIFQQQL